MKPKWPKKIVVVRHGRSLQNDTLDLLDGDIKEKLMAIKKIRDADIPLVEEGFREAERTGILLSKEEPFDYCFCSPYLRTEQTSKVIIENIGYPLKVYYDNRLREKEFGRLHGFKGNEIRDVYPEEFEDRERDGKYYYRLPRGENYPDVEQRIHSVLGKFSRNYVGKNILVVTHQVPYKSFRTLFEHLSEKEVLALEDAPNCGIEEFRIDTSKHKKGVMKLQYYNRVA